MPIIAATLLAFIALGFVTAAWERRVREGRALLRPVIFDTLRWLSYAWRWLVTPTPARAQPQPTRTSLLPVPIGAPPEILTPQKETRTMNNLEKWAINQTLGAGAADNLSAAADAKVGAILTGTSTGVSLPSEASVQSEIQSYVDELASGLLKHANPFLATIVVAFINSAIGGWVSSAYAKYAPQAQAKIGSFNSGVGSIGSAAGNALSSGGAG